MPNLSSLDQGGACNPGLASEGSWLSIVEPEWFVHCKQASLLRLLGVLDSYHLPHKGRQRYIQKTEQ